MCSIICSWKVSTKDCDKTLPPLNAIAWSSSVLVSKVLRPLGGDGRYLMIKLRRLGLQRFAAGGVCAAGVRRCEVTGVSGRVIVSRSTFGDLTSSPDLVFILITENLILTSSRNGHSNHIAHRSFLIHHEMIILTSSGNAQSDLVTKWSFWPHQRTISLTWSRNDCYDRERLVWPCQWTLINWTHCEMNITEV